MRKRIMSLVVIVAMVMAFATPAFATTTVEGKLLDYPMIGSLEDYASLVDWLADNTGISAAQIEDWLRDNGVTGGENITNIYADTEVCVDYDVNTGGASAFVEVCDCPVCNIDVGYAIVDALGKLTVELEKVGLNFKDGEASFTLTNADIFALLSGVTVSGPLGDGASFSLDLGTGAGTLFVGTYAVPFVFDYTDAENPISVDVDGFVDAIFADSGLSGPALTVAKSVARTLINGAVNSQLKANPDFADMAELLNNLSYSIALDELRFLEDALSYSAGPLEVDVPYSFAYGFDGELVNGTSTTISLNETIEKSWLKNVITGYEADYSVYLTEEVINRAAGAIDDADLSALQAILAGSGLDQMLDLGALLGVQGVDVDATAVLGNVKVLLADKLRSDWGTTLTNVGVVFKGSYLFEAGAITNIKLADVTNVPLAPVDAVVKSFKVKPGLTYDFSEYYSAGASCAIDKDASDAEAADCITFDADGNVVVDKDAPDGLKVVLKVYTEVECCHDATARVATENVTLNLEVTADDDEEEEEEEIVVPGPTNPAAPNLGDAAFSGMTMLSTMMLLGTILTRRNELG